MFNGVDIYLLVAGALSLPASYGMYKFAEMIGTRIRRWRSGRGCIDVVQVGDDAIARHAITKVGNETDADIKVGTKSHRYDEKRVFTFSKNFPVDVRGRRFVLVNEHSPDTLDPRKDTHPWLDATTFNTMLDTKIVRDVTRSEKDATKAAISIGVIIIVGVVLYVLAKNMGWI